MEQFFLKRLSNTIDFGVFGVLLHGDIPFAVTLELPWKDNKPEESCIPIGLYRCERTISPKFGKTFEVVGVQERTHILFHKGNFTKDTKGCILIGEMFEPIEGRPGIIKSGRGFNEFMERLRGEDRFALNIMWA